MPSSRGHRRLARGPTDGYQVGVACSGSLLGTLHRNFVPCTPSSALPTPGTTPRTLHRACVPCTPPRHARRTGTGNLERTWSVPYTSSGVPDMPSSPLHRKYVPCTPPFLLTPTRRTLHPTTLVPSTVNAYPAPALRTLHPALPFSRLPAVPYTRPPSYPAPGPHTLHPAVPCTPTVLVPSTGTAYPTPGPRPRISGSPSPGTLHPIRAYRAAQAYPDQTAQAPRVPYTAYPSPKMVSDVGARPMWPVRSRRVCGPCAEQLVTLLVPAAAPAARRRVPYTEGRPPRKGGPEGPPPQGIRPLERPPRRRPPEEPGGGRGLGSYP